MVFIDLEVDEGLTISDLKPRVVTSFVANRRKFAVGHAGTAHRTCPMSRIKDRLIPEIAYLAQGII